MPLYEFHCPSCDHTFEELVFEDEAVACPDCASQQVTKLLSLPGPPTSQIRPLPLASACGDPSLPPCGAPWCQRKG
ncbi:MAG: zinc ribbon domain-containing protein [Gemmataceae bacterium]|nr:zinc ribbon domain-containing protein [Gemmataceae bacterium]